MRSLQEMCKTAFTGNLRIHHPCHQHLHLVHFMLLHQEAVYLLRHLPRVQAWALGKVLAEEQVGPYAFHRQTAHKGDATLLSVSIILLPVVVNHDVT